MKTTAGLFLHLFLTALASLSFSQTSGITTYCNPLDIDYKYIWEQAPRKISFRAGADPVIVTFKGEYYLFSTVQGGGGIPRPAALGFCRAGQMAGR